MTGAERRPAMLPLLVALGIDNFGSGLFLPLTLIYTTTVVGLDVGTAGVVLALGTALGLAVPALTGRVVDRVGARTVVAVSQVVQGAGMGSYFLASGAAGAVLASVLIAAGTQMFYSALLGMIADAAPEGPKDRPFALVSMVRSGAFGAGTLAGGLLLSLDGDALRWVVAADAASFVVSALLILRFVPLVRRAHGDRSAPRQAVWRDRPFVLLITAAGLIALAGDFFLVGFPLYARDRLATPSWIIGVSFTLLTAITSLAGTAAVRATRRLRRTTTMCLGATLILLWCAGMALAAWLPPQHRTAAAIGAVLLFALGSLLCDSRAGAMAEAAAPAHQRGAYLAAFQYSFTGAQLLAPVLASLFAFGSWLPWAVVAASLVLSVVLMVRLSSALPARAVWVGERAQAGATP